MRLLRTSLHQEQLTDNSIHSMSQRSCMNSFSLSVSTHNPSSTVLLLTQQNHLLQKPNPCLNSAHSANVSTLDLPTLDANPHFWLYYMIIVRSNRSLLIHRGYFLMLRCSRLSRHRRSPIDQGKAHTGRGFRLRFRA